MPDTETARLVDRLMRRMSVDLQQNAKNFDHFSVGQSGGTLLLTLAEQEPVRLQDVAAAMTRDKSQVTRLVQMLEGKGLILRSPCPTDARASLLSLTALGRDAIEHIQGGISSALANILAPLSANEQRTLKELLRKI